MIRQPRRRVGAVLVALALVAGACSEDDPYSFDSLEPVCDGEPHELGPELTEDGPNLLSLLVRESPEDNWAWDPFLDGELAGEFIDGEFVDDFTALLAPDAAMVVCLTVKDSSVDQLCTFEDGYEIEYRDAEYDVVLRATATGEVLDETSADVDVDTDCGIFTLVSDDDPKSSVQWPSPDHALADFLDPWIHGTGD